MACHDPIADMLTKIRNASTAKHEEVFLKYSNEKYGIIKILKDEGYIDFYKKDKKDKIDQILVKLKYDERQPLINGIKKISKPGRRIYKGYKDMPRLYNGMGTVVVSTSTGIITGKEASSKKIGGEILCYIW